MKTENQQEKLALNKRTISTLHVDLMSEIKDGDFTVGESNCAACEAVSLEVCLPTLD